MSITDFLVYQALTNYYGGSSSSGVIAKKTIDKETSLNEVIGAWEFAPKLSGTINHKTSFRLYFAYYDSNAECTITRRLYKNNELIDTKDFNDTIENGSTLEQPISIDDDIRIEAFNNYKIEIEITRLTSNKRLDHLQIVNTSLEGGVIQKLIDDAIIIKDETEIGV